MARTIMTGDNYYISGELPMLNADRKVGSKLLLHVGDHDLVAHNFLLPAILESILQKMNVTYMVTRFNIPEFSPYALYNQKTNDFIDVSSKY